MTNNKPEWFEIAEKDGPAKPPKASKSLPLAAVFATVLILGVGAVVGQVQQESPVVAADNASVQSEAISATTSSTPVVSNPQSSSVGAASIATTALQNPSIAQLPTKGDDEDDDDDEDEDDDDDYEDEDDENEEDDD